MKQPQDEPVPTIFILSGGIGASGEQLVHTALAQFPENNVRVITFGNMRQPEQISDAILQAKQAGALVVHTMVDPLLQAFLEEETVRHRVPAVDLMGPLLEWVSETLDKAPRAQPGLYRQLRREYFERVAAIDFTMNHDDGKNPEGWAQADAVLVGVSRVGKTPLSLYLAVLGFKIANYPLVPHIPAPEQLYALDPKRVFGLTIEPDQLLQFRLRRQRQLGVPGVSDYMDPEAVYEEVQAALKLFRRGRFTIVDMTDKTIEMGADEIIRHLA